MQCVYMQVPRIVFRVLPIIVLTSLLSITIHWKVADRRSSPQTLAEFQNRELFIPDSTFETPFGKCNISEEPESFLLPARLGGDIIGFYNLFKQDENIFRMVVDEQIQFLESSGLSAASRAVNVVYFGVEHESFRVPTNSSKFVLARSSFFGDERDTLQLLHDHCVNNPLDTVFYIHSKGTFHPSDSNDLLRRNLMKAVAACWQQAGAARHDVCGLRASPLPHPHFSGNMWLARCDYIATLRRPADFEAAMGAAARDREPECEPWMVGADRFSQEHWVLSHPSAVVADVLPLSDPLFVWGYDDLPDPGSWAPALATFPRPSLPFAPFLGPRREFFPFLACAYPSRRAQEYEALFGPGAAAGLPCASMHCRWYPAVLAQLRDAVGEASPVGAFLRDLFSEGAPQCGPAQPAAGPAPGQ